MKTITKIYSTAGVLSAILALIICPAFADAATFTAVASGSWSANATWAGGVAPGSNISNDQIIIGSGLTVTADSDITIDGALASIDVDGTLDASAHSVAVIQGTVSGTGQIIVDEMSSATAAVILFAGQIDAHTFINNSASLTLAAVTNVDDELHLNGGVLVIGSGGLTLAGGTQVVVNGGSMSLSGGLFTATQSYTVVYVGDGGTVGLEASGSGLTGLEVDLDDSNAELMLAGDLVINGSLDLTQGELVVGNNSLTVNGMIHGSGSASIDAMAGSEIHITSSGTGTLDVAFSGSPEVLAAFEFDGSSGATLQLGGDLQVTGDFDFSGGTIHLNGNTLSVSGDFNGNGEFSASAGSAIEISGNGSIEGGLMFSAGNQMIDNIAVDLSNGQSIMIGSDVWVQNSFDFQNGTIEIGSGNTLGLNGSATLGANAMFEGNSDANLEISTSSSVIGDITFSNGSATIGDLTVDIDGNGSVSLGSDLGVNGELDLQNGMLDLNGNTIMINGDIASGGSGSISVDGSSDIEIHASGSLSGSLNFSSGSSTMGDLVIDIDNGGSVMLGSDAGVSGTLDLQNGFVALGSNDLMVSGSISGGSSTSYVMTNGQGSLMLDVMAGGSSMFPVGTDVHFSPAVLAQASGSASGMFGVSAMNGVLVNGTSGNFMSSWGSMVDHTWNVTSELSSNIDLDLTLTWEASAEVNGFTNAQSYISHYTNAAWDVSATAAATVNGQGNFELTRTGITSLSPFAVFDSNTAVGVDEAEELSVSFYPNPAVDVLNYDMAGNTASMQIDVFDAAGRIVLTKTEQSSRGVIDMSDYPAGIYTIRIANEEQNQTARIVKQ